MQQNFGHSNRNPLKTQFELPRLIPVIVMVQHSRSGVWSEHCLQLPVTAYLSSIKKDLETMFNIPAENQNWMYKHREMNDADCLFDLRIKPNEYILVTIKVVRCTDQDTDICIS